MSDSSLVRRNEKRILEIAKESGLTPRIVTVFANNSRNGRVLVSAEHGIHWEEVTKLTKRELHEFTNMAEVSIQLIEDMMARRGLALSDSMTKVTDEMVEAALKKFLTYPPSVRCVGNADMMREVIRAALMARGTKP